MSIASRPASAKSLAFTSRGLSAWSLIIGLILRSTVVWVSITLGFVTGMLLRAPSDIPELFAYHDPAHGLTLGPAVALIAFLLGPWALAYAVADVPLNIFTLMRFTQGVRTRLFVGIVCTSTIVSGLYAFGH